MPTLSMKRIMLLSVIGRAIQEIEADPKRGLRRMIDLGQDLVHGDSAQEIFSFLQQVLHKQTSPCYALLERMVREVDHKTLQHFGVALGWDSWTEGCKLLRQSPEEQKWAEPLVIEETDTLRGLHAEVKKYAAKGVRTFFVTVESQKALYTALQLASSETTCAMILFMPPTLIDNQTAARISLCHTVCAVLYDQPEREKAQAILRRAKCLYGVYHVCTAEDTAAGIQSWLEQLGGAYFAIVQELEADNQIAKQIAAFRQTPTVPLLPIAARKDFADIQARICKKR